MMRITTLSSPIRPEGQLLIHCARTDMSPHRAERVRMLLQAGLDWEYLLRAALRHGMMPLLYWHLKAFGPEAIPPTVLGSLREYYEHNRKKNLFMTGELLGLLSLFEARGIPAIPFKGPALAASVYGNLALRQFGDLDILVSQPDVLRAKEALIAQGYRPHAHLTGAQEAAFLRYHNEYIFEGSEDHVVVEIQWRIAPRYFSFPLDPGRLSERLATTALGGKHLRTLAPEDALLILCAHGVKHLWTRLNWICDIAELVRVHTTMDWEQVIKQAGELGGQRMLWVGLLLAYDLLDAVLPEKVLQRVQAESVAISLAAQIRQRLFSLADDPPGIMESILFHLRAREFLRDRIRYGFRIAMTPTAMDLTFLPVPSYLFFLYYPLRAARLLQKYGPRMLVR